jgi:hypothetical protein
MSITLDEAIPSYVAERIRRPPPLDCGVLSGSTPVVAFGDAGRSSVATLGLNPSRIEFEERGVELDGRRRRFETLRSLGAERLDDAPDAVIVRVWHRCNNYFHGNPYRRWFNRLEKVLNAIDVSYFGDTACHLDLSQWATNPTWKDLSPTAREHLIAGDADFLRMQLRLGRIRLLLLNGHAVLTAFQTVLGGRLVQEKESVTDRSVTARVYTGRIGDVQMIGWSTNLQSSFGVTNLFQTRLSDTIRRLRDRALA